MLKTIEITDVEMMEALRASGYEVKEPPLDIPRHFVSEEEFADWLNAYTQASGIFVAIQNVKGDVYEVALLTAVPFHYSQVDSLARYFFEGPFAGEYLGTETVEADSDGVGRLFILSADFTKSRHDDWGDSIPALWPMLRDGTPIRKTDRKGPGTKGTRAVEGLHTDFWLAFS